MTAVGKIPSATGAFSKLKGIFIKIIPFIGIAIGFFSYPFVHRPISHFLDTIFVKMGLNRPRTGDVGIFSKVDMGQYIVHIPTGLIMALIAGGAGLLLKHFFGGGIIDIVGNFLIGVSVGFFISALYFPIAEDVWKWW